MGLTTWMTSSISAIRPRQMSCTLLDQVLKHTYRSRRWTNGKPATLHTPTSTHSCIPGWAQNPAESYNFINDTSFCNGPAPVARHPLLIETLSCISGAVTIRNLDSMISLQQSRLTTDHTLQRKLFCPLCGGECVVLQVTNEHIRNHTTHKHIQL